MKEYTIENEQLKVEVLDYGGAIKNIFFKGIPMVIAFENTENYLTYPDPYLNAIVGPLAGRIEHGRLNEYTLSINNGAHHLHGGISTTARKYFEITQVSSSKLHLHLTTTHDEDGYPEGEFRYDVEYEVKGATLEIKYLCVPPKPLPISLTSHLYFNLHSKDILTSKLQMAASKRLVVDETYAPSKIVDVVDAYDFRTPTLIKENLSKGSQEFNWTINYDHPFILDEGKIHMEDSEYALDVATDQKAVVIYSANFFTSDLPLAHNVEPKPLCSLAIECSDIPNYPNLGITRLYDESHPYKQVTSFTFSKLG